MTFENKMRERVNKREGEREKKKQILFIMKQKHKICQLLCSPEES